MLNVTTLWSFSSSIQYNKINLTVPNNVLVMNYDDFKD